MEFVVIGFTDDGPAWGSIVKVDTLEEGRKVARFLIETVAAYTKVIVARRGTMETVATFVAERVVKEDSHDSNVQGNYP